MIPSDFRSGPCELAADPFLEPSCNDSHPDPLTDPDPPFAVSDLPTGTGGILPRDRAHEPGPGSFHLPPVP